MRADNISALADQERIDQNILDDVMQPSDRKEALDSQSSNREKRNAIKNNSVTISKFVASLGLPKPNGHGKNQYAEKVKAYNKKAPFSRWYNDLIPDNEEIYELKPADAAVYCDLSCGCYRVHHRGLPGSRRCFSWTKRGVPAAVSASLSQMWAWETQLTGQVCPLPPELLAHA